MVHIHSTASTSSSSLPSPLTKVAPAGPVSVSEKGWPWVVPQSATMSAMRRPSWSGDSTGS